MATIAILLGTWFGSEIWATAPALSLMVLAWCLAGDK